MCLDYVLTYMQFIQDPVAGSIDVFGQRIDLHAVNLIKWTLWTTVAK